MDEELGSGVVRIVGYDDSRWKRNECGLALGRGEGVEGFDELGCFGPWGGACVEHLSPR